MNDKITKKRLANLISYDWFLICVFIVIAIVLWSVLFTTFAPKTTLGQQFYFYVYGEMYSPNGEKLLSDAQKNGYLSYDVRQKNFSQVSGQNAETQILSWLSVGQGDVLAVTEETFPFASTAYYDLKQMVSDAKEYCLSYGTSADGKTFMPDERKIAVLFSERKSDDKRFKTQEQKERGAELEVQRICSLWKSAYNIESYFEYCSLNGIDLFKYAVVTEEEVVFLQANPKEEGKDQDEKYILSEEDWQRLKKPYGLDVSKLVGGKSFIEVAYRYKEDQDGELTVKTAEGIYLCVLDYRTVQEHLQFEAVTFIDYVVKTYGGYDCFKVTD